MEFAIEAPGAANPLSTSALSRTLALGVCGNNQQIQVATNQLKEWEHTSGYFPLLQGAAADQSLPGDVRQLAIIQLRRVADHHWRRATSQPLPKEDKDAVRSRLIELALSEEDDRLGLMTALMVAKIGRFDYPKEWPDLFDSLAAALQQSYEASDHIRNLRALDCILQLVKEFSTARMIRHRQVLLQVGPKFVSIIGQQYMSACASWQQSMQTGPQDMEAFIIVIRQTQLALKILRRLFICGYEFPNRDDTVKQFWQIAAKHLGDYLGIASQNGAGLPETTLKIIEDHAYQLAKLHLAMCQTHPQAFVLLPGALDVAKSYWSIAAGFGDKYRARAPESVQNVNDLDADDQDEVSLEEKLALKGLLLLRACMKMIFNPAPSLRYRHEEEKGEIKNSREVMKSEMFTESMVMEMLGTIVTKYFCFTAKDLVDWRDDPEDWEQREDSDSSAYEYSIRGCAEKIFLDISIHYKSMAIGPLLNTFNSVAGPDQGDVLLKESVYTAIGLAAAVLRGHLNFSDFLKRTLVAEVQMTRPNYHILRRRTAILLGQWTSIDIPKEDRAVVYEIFTHLLNPADILNDPVVRFAAGRELSQVINDWDFDPEVFQPFADIIMQRLLLMIREFDMIESKLTLLQTIRIIVERMEDRITPHGDHIVTTLLELWHQEQGTEIVNQFICTTLGSIVVAMKDQSVRYQEQCVAIIRATLEPGSPLRVFLLEDVLDLWEKVISNTPSQPRPSDGLMQLISFLFELLTMDSELLRVAVQVAEGYLLLVPGDVLGDWSRKELLRVLASLLVDGNNDESDRPSSLKPDSHGLVLAFLETIICVATGLGGEAGVRILVSDMIDCGIWGYILGALRGTYIRRVSRGQTAGGRAQKGASTEENGLWKWKHVEGPMESDLFSIIARIAWVNPLILQDALALWGHSAVNLRTQQSPDADRIASTKGEEFGSMRWLIDEWLNHTEHIGDPGKRKLMNLGLAKVFGLGTKIALERLQDFMTSWTDIIYELIEGQNDKTVDSMVFSADTLSPPDTPEDARRRHLTFSDPIRSVNIIAVVREVMTQAVDSAGGQAAFNEEQLSNVDQKVIEGFQNVVNL
ncbi:ARM repeat-containing protein [Eremomyces bilateralis CBS 781.70]|uniref:ARM repeat-containing protein n=1 Tax=Eremomyces bilateralis CBS 781.70 TaxID=1392243 RepID=A0A6G1FUL3_9PEZI|nr:ARM repeat-containing protein [Eremomyces bilateralis CBS 781.70]KAF1809388.1 ARM repeat-containing protein [Eremomyces bilateralis CBS 781.70]